MADDNITTGSITFDSATPFLVKCSLKSVIHPTDYTVMDASGVYWRVTGFQHHYELLQVTAKEFNVAPTSLIDGTLIAPDVTAEKMLVLQIPSDIDHDDVISENEHDYWELADWRYEDRTIDATSIVVINGQEVSKPTSDTRHYVVIATLRCVTQMTIDRGAYTAEKLDDPSALSDAPDV